MSAQPAALVEKLGKCYHVYDNHFDRLRQSFTLTGRRFHKDFWALREVSFDIEKGETVGIVGANGSGKSTLLQLLFGVLQPTEGSIRIDGKVNGLLELGGGFNPEETGRQNVLINASILGVQPKDVPALFDRIESFADIGDFIDQPVKVYSSGMSVRLGFALQISVPCDILIIDEALAVGDELFQRKCYAALEKFRDDGGTVLFVSHSAASVKQMCRRALLLDHGRLVQAGKTRTVVDNYQKFLYMREPERSQFRDFLMSAGPAPMDDDAPPPATFKPEATPDVTPRSADYEPGLHTQSPGYYQPNGAVITDIRIEDFAGRKVNQIDPHGRYLYKYRVTFDKHARNILFGWLVKSTSGYELGGGAQECPAPELSAVEAGDVYDVTFEFTASLHPGVYFLNCGVSGTTDEYDGFLHRVIDAVAFRVRNPYAHLHTGFVDFDYKTRFARAAAPAAACPSRLELTVAERKPNSDDIPTSSHSPELQSTNRA